MTDETSQIAHKAAAIADEIRPLLAGKGAAVQGAVLMQLTATWLAGHRVTQAELDKVLQFQFDHVRRLAQFEFMRIHGRRPE